MLRHSAPQRSLAHETVQFTPQQSNSRSPSPIDGRLISWWRSQPAYLRIKSAALSIAAGAVIVLATWETIALQAPAASMPPGLRWGTVVVVLAALAVLLQLAIAQSVGAQTEAGLRARLAEAEVRARLERGQANHLGDLCRLRSRLDQAERRIANLQAALTDLGGRDRTRLEQLEDVEVEVRAIKDAIHLVAGGDGARIVPLHRAPRD